MRQVPNSKSQIGNVPAKLVSPPSASEVWCQRWNTGVASTYLNGPKVQFRLACTKAEWKVVKGATQTMTFGEMPAISRTTSTPIVPSTRLTGWKRAAEIQLISSEE